MFYQNLITKSFYLFIINSIKLRLVQFKKKISIKNYNLDLNFI